jgi:hypothetical protein
MNQLRDKMISAFRLGNYSDRTATEYLRCIRNFSAHYMRCPSELGRVEVRGSSTTSSWSAACGPRP